MRPRHLVALLITYINSAQQFYSFTNFTNANIHMLYLKFL